MFKKKKQGLFNAADDTEVIVNDFARRYPFEDYRPVEYKPYHKLLEEEMKPRLDHHLEALFAGEVDDANGDMLDNIIFGTYRESLSDLGMQRHSHAVFNRRLAARRHSDREDFGRLAEERKKELTDLEKDYEEIRERVKGRDE